MPISLSTVRQISLSNLQYCRAITGRSLTNQSAQSCRKYFMRPLYLCFSTGSFTNLAQRFKRDLRSLCSHPLRTAVEQPIGEPIPGKLSVSIRDAVRSDYMEYDNNIFTDLLLTSDLKGYIHQPGYYFTESSSGNRRNWIYC